MVGPARGRPRISLILADVDGTLVTKEKALTPRAASAVKALPPAVIAFAITSGRQPRGMSMLIEALALQTPIAGFNGGIFVNPDMTILEQHVLAADAAKLAIDVIQRNNMDVWIYSGNNWFVRNLDAPHVAREQWTVKFAPTVVSNFDGLLGNVTKIVGVSDDYDLVAPLRKGRPGGDITHPDAFAPSGRRLDRSLIISRPQRDRCYHAIGTGQRDRDHWRHAERYHDVSQKRAQYRDGNASHGVQVQANRVTDSYEDEGFAKAIERFILPLAGSTLPRTS